MNMIKADKENNIFGALKLIEQLYLDGEIPGYVFRNILQEYKDDVCIVLLEIVINNLNSSINSVLAILAGMNFLTSSYLMLIFSF